MKLKKKINEIEAKNTKEWEKGNNKTRNAQRKKKRKSKKI